jgi:flagellar biosynthesis/type III secretory pathway protein FliH
MSLEQFRWNKMPNFTVQFDAPVVATKVEGNLYAVGTPIERTIADAGESSGGAAVSAILTSIQQELHEVHSEIKNQNQTMRSLAIDYAIQAVTIILSSDDELVEERLRKNLLRIFESADEFEAAKVYVHPQQMDCVSGLLNTTEGIDFLIDTSLEPGDCRVDFGASGRIANLENQLTLIKNRLEQAIRNQDWSKAND